MYKWKYDQIENSAYKQFIDIFSHEGGKCACHAKHASIKVTLDKKPPSWTGSKIPKAANVLSPSLPEAQTNTTVSGPWTFLLRDYSTFSALLISWPSLMWENYFYG